VAIPVLLADDHAVVRDGLRLVLEGQEDISVLACVADGREAIRKVQQLSPKVVVMDIAMPGLNGIDATARIREVSPSTKVLILSMHSTSEHIYRAFQAGACGYLLKESAGKEVVEAVRAVHSGQRYLSQKIASIVIDYTLQAGEEMPPRSPLERLSPREREILQLVVEGKSSAEIGEIVYLSRKTVETYRSRMMAKLGVGDLPSLVRLAIEHGLTPPG
jgi:DNA-binding NarL/FixJ family response regulator